MISPTSDQHVPAARKLLLLLAIVTSGVIATGFVVVQEPLLVIGAIAVLVLIAGILIHPDAATVAVLFILYSNAAVVAVRYHGVPFFVGASLPVLLVIPLGYYLVFRRQELVVDYVVPLMAFFLLVQLIGAIFAVDVGEALSVAINFAIEGLGIYFLIINTVRSERTLRWAVWTLVIAGLFMGGLTFYQQVSQTYENEYAGFAQVSNAAFGTGEEGILGEVEQPRLAGPIGEVNRYAQTLLMLVPLALFRFWGERSRALRALAAVAVLFIGLGTALTFSRGAVIGMFMMLIIVAFLRYIKFSQLIMILVVSLLVLQLVPQYGERLSSLELFTTLFSGDETFNIQEADGATRSRLTEMGAAVLVFADHPVVGVGPGMFSYYYREYAERIGIRVLDADRESHSLIPGIAAEYGALGLLSYLAILYVTARNLVRVRSKHAKSNPQLANIATALLLALITYMTTGVFLHMTYIRFFWVIMGLAGAAIHLGQKQSETVQPGETATAIA